MKIDLVYGEGNGEQITINDYLNNDNQLTTGS